MINKKISVIIPAFNEERYISNVITSLICSKHVDEIIVVNDGSTDNTLILIKKFKQCHIINLKKNHGKGYAVAKGVSKSTGDIIVFLDADLIGLKEKHIDLLINPLLKKKAVITIGYPNYIQADKLFRPLSGERAYWKKELIPHLNDIAKKGYGLELYLNHLFRNKKIKLFPLPGVKNALKYEKQPYDTVAKLFLVESFDILSEILKQNNPVSYLMKSYLYSFYIQKPKETNNRMDRLIKYIKTNIIDNIIK